MLCQAEFKVLTYDHAQIGEALLREWQYPVQLVEAVAFHHQPMAAPSHNTSAAIVHLADHLVNALQLGSSGERFVPPLDPRAWQHLGFASDILESLIAAMDDQMVTVETVFLAPRKTPRRR